MRFVVEAVECLGEEEADLLIVIGESLHQGVGRVVLQEREGFASRRRSRHLAERFYEKPIFEGERFRTGFQEIEKGILYEFAERTDLSRRHVREAERGEILQKADGIDSGA